MILKIASPTYVFNGTVVQPSAIGFISSMQSLMTSLKVVVSTSKYLKSIIVALLFKKKKFCLISSKYIHHNYNGMV